MSEMAASAEATPVATQANPSPTDPAPQETPANGQTPGTLESNAQEGSGAGEPAAAKPDEGKQGDQAEKPKSRTQEKIDKSTFEKREAQRQRDAALARVAELEKQLKPPGPNASLEEHDDYRIKKAMQELRVDELQHEARSAQVQASRATFDTFTAKAEAVADRMPDVVEKFCALPEISPAMASFVAESEKGAEVAYYLANNEREATHIARLSDFDQGRELARLEGKLSVAPQVRRTSSAPPPVPTVTGNPSPSGKDPADMTEAEYIANWKKREAAKKRG